MWVVSQVEEGELSVSCLGGFSLTVLFSPVTRFLFSLLVQERDSQGTSINVCKEIIKEPPTTV